MYYIINHASVSGGSASMNVALDIPETVDGIAYTVTYPHATGVDTSYQVMNVTLHINKGSAQTSTLVTLGDNINWQNSIVFSSIYKKPNVVATKTANIITITVGGT